MKKTHFIAAIVLTASVASLKTLQDTSDSDFSYSTFIFGSNHQLEVDKGAISTEENQNGIDSDYIIKGDVQSIVVGGSVDKRYDHPRDNSIRFVLTEKPTENDYFILEYELKGAVHPAELTTSWNDELSSNWARFTPNNNWEHWSEKIHFSRLKQGTNILRFNRTKTSDYYELGKISLRKVTVNSSPHVFFLDEMVPIYDTIGYVRLHVQAPTQLLIQGQLFNLESGNHVVEYTFSALEEKLIYHAKTSSGAIQQGTLKTVQIKDYETRISEEFQTFETVLALNTKSWAYDGYFVNITAASGAVLEDTEVKIQPLRKKDLPPLAPGMINVTAGAAGYRMLPDNIQFEENIRLSLRIDSALLPKGFSTAHVRTYFFDEKLRSWTMLPQDSAEKSGLWAGAYTDHFTDFVNAIIKAPELPSNQAHVPTSFSGLTAAHPLSGINQISPPSANSKGDLSLVFPIEIPQGRNGLQPSLQLTYNSSAGNGPFGLGWNLNVPSIQIDTRWGVPRFDTTKESEAYLVNGEQLDVVGYQLTLNTLRSASGNSKTFRYRVEGKFDSIVRFGTSPETYVWQVYETTGKIYYYGCRSNGNTVIPSLVLKSPSGAIAHWSLGEVVDAQGNKITYEYFHAGSNPVQNIPTPSKITYSEGSDPGFNYYIDFGGWEDRDNDAFITTIRDDATVDMRFGFPVATDLLINRISVVHGNSIIGQGTAVDQGIRTYLLNYKTGAFKKTLLCTIGEISNASGSYEDMLGFMDDVCANAGTSSNIDLPWNVKIHRFSYHEFDNETTPLFSDAKQLVGHQPAEITFQELSDNAGNLKSLSNNVESIGVPETGANKSGKGKLNQSRNISFGGNASVYVGIGSNVLSKNNSISAAVSGSISHAKTTIGFFDIDGDGYPDRVFKQNNEFRYQPVGKIGNEFGLMESVGSPLTNLSGIATSVSTQSGWNAQVQAASVLVANFTRSTSTTISNQYFTDVDADGFPDLVDGNIIRFNRLGTNGNGRNFELPTSNTVWVDECNFIDQTGHVDPELGKDFSFPPREFNEPVDQDIEEKLLDHNTVSVWVAPRSGHITINSILNVREPDYVEPWQQSYANGMYYAIQHNKQELVMDSIEHDDFNIDKANDFAFNVNAGDLIFFRLMSKGNRDFDDVVWNREIIYTFGSQSSDADGKSNSNFDAGADYLPVQYILTQMPFDGDVDVSIDINSLVLSDDVRLKVWKNNAAPFINLVFPAGQNINYSYFQNHIVSEDDQLNFEIISNSKIDYSKLNITPLVKYKNANIDGQNVSLNSTSEWAQVNIIPMFQMNPLSRNYAPSLPNTLNPGTYSVTSDLQFQNPTVLSTYTGDIILTAKENGILKGELLLEVNNGTINYPNGNSFNITVSNTGTYHFCYNFEKPLESSILIKHTVQVKQGGSGSNFSAGVFMPYDTEFEKFGTLYRGWGQFIYAGDQLSPINIGSLFSGLEAAAQNLEQADTINFEATTSQTTTTPPSLEGMMSNFGNHLATMLDNSFYRMFVNPETKEWYAPGSYGRVKGHEVYNTNRVDELSSVQVSNPVPVVTSAITGKVIWKKTKQRSDTWSIGAGPSILRVGGTLSSGNGMILADYRDMNGDGYPDNLSREKVQFTNPRGGLQGGGSMYFPAKFNETFNNSTGGNLGGGAKMWEAKPTQSPQSTGGAISSIGEIQASLGVDVGDANNEERYGLFDMNGDGLPDMILHNHRVRLSTGYGFETTERDWQYSMPSSKTGSITFGGDGGLNFVAQQAKSKAEESWAFGVGYNTSSSNSEIMPIDINGDGLLDFIEFEYGLSQQTPELSTLHLNLGTRFETYQNYYWAANNNFQAQSNSEAINLNIAGTAGIPILFLKAGVSLGANGGFTISRDRGAFIDVNNDGYVDYVEDMPDSNNLVVRYNNIGKANLLKSAELVTGATYAFDYEPLVTSVQMPKSKWLFTQLIVDDNYIDDGYDKSFFTYSYHHPNYQRFERVFLGFDSVNTNQWNQNRNTILVQKRERFHNSDVYFTGLKYREAIVQVSGSNTTYWAINIYDHRPHSILTGQVISNPACADPFYPALFQEEIYHTEGSATSSIGTKKVYHRGEKGIIIKFDDYADLSDPNDDYSAHITYTQNPVKYIYGLPVNISIREGLTVSGNLLRERQANYNAHGKMTSMKVLLSGNSPNGIYASDSFEYDGYGNITKHLYPANVNGERYSMQFTYDSRLHMYPETVTDTWGLTSTFEYLYVNGQVLKFTDAYGQITDYYYDELYNPFVIVGPNEQGHNYLSVYTIKYDNSWHGNQTYPPSSNTFWAETKHYDDQYPDGIRTIVITDGLGQEIQVKKSAFVADNAYSAPTDRWIVSGWREKDELGRVIRQWHPTTSAISSSNAYQVVTTPDPVQPTNISYDYLNRPINIMLPDGTNQTNTYGLTSVNGLIMKAHTITDHLNNSQQNISDFTGQSIRSIRNGNNVTSFSYSPIGELLSSTDPEQNITEYIYDKAGRLKQRNHPDAGVDRFVYDAAGNVITKERNKNYLNNTTIDYSYSYNRLMSIEYPENPENNVYYAYGTAGFEKGRVHRIEDASGAQELAYGPMGEIIRKTNSLVDLNQFTYTFSSFWQYDSWGRIRKIVYPDGEEVTYQYDPGGKLNAIHSSNGDSYLDDVYYDKFENKVMEALGNGTQMLYSYSADMRRLSELKAHYAGNYFLDVSYSYDQVGNITGIQNSAGSKDNLGGAFSHEYSYDALYRLTSANGTSGSSHYDLEMAYSPSGNILSKMVAGQLTDIQQGSFPVHYTNDYNYNSSAPHQVAGIVDQNSGSSFNFEWDLNGNMTLHTEMIQGITKQRRLCWDEENRLLLSADEEQLAGYVYDAAGMRTHKASGTTVATTVNGHPSYFGSISSMTLYPSELITVSTGMYTKHYYNGSQRLASRIGGGFAPHPDLNHYDPLTDQVELPHSGDYQHKARLLVELWTRQAECAGLQPSLEFSYSLAEGNLHNPLPEPADGERYFYHSDHLGSSAFITSENGYATQFLAYMPFGETLDEQQNSSNYYSPFKFSAKEKDPETGYSYFGARYYSPELSVWLSVDPKATLMPSWSAYSYAFNNPVVFIDPDGKLPIPIVSGLVFAGGGALYGLLTGKSREETLALAAGGFVAGATFGLGSLGITAVGGVATLGGANIAYIYGASGLVGASMGNLVEQGIRNLFGTQEGFNENEFVISMAFGIPETILGRGVTGPISNSMKGAIAKELTKEVTFKQERALLKQTAKSLKEASGGQITNRQARIAAQKLYNMARDTEQGVINATIYVTDKAVDVTTITIEKIMVAPINECTGE